MSRSARRRGCEQAKARTETPATTSGYTRPCAPDIGVLPRVFCWRLEVVCGRSRFPSDDDSMDLMEETAAHTLAAVHVLLLHHFSPISPVPYLPWCRKTEQAPLAEYRGWPCWSFLASILIYVQGFK